MQLLSYPKILSTSEVNDILAQFPENACITRAESIAVVRSPDGKRIFSAAEIQKDRWHVLTVPGLLLEQPQEPRS